MTTAYQVNAYQNNAYQIDVIAIPAFDGCAFQFDAFQAAPCPVPPEPILNDGHDGGRKKAQKKLRELEEKRIRMMREDGERRKLLIRHAIDPQAKLEYEAKLAAANKVAEPAKDIAKEIEKIDRQIERVQKLKQNMKIQQFIQAELNVIKAERAVRDREIRRQIQEADDELALMMMM